MPDTFLRDTDLADRYGVSRNTIWRWGRERPDFPKPVSLSTRCTRWRMADILEWEQAVAA